MSLSLYGPEDLDVSEDPLVRTWPIPYTAHEIRLRDVETFEVSPEDDAYVAIEPYFYVPGFAGTPKRLESGERYESWGRQVNALMVYVGALRTQSGAQLCTGHFPDAMHPELAITVSSATPEVCSPWTPDQDRLGDLQHPNAAARWFVGREAVRIDRDGRCELTYSFYLNGEDTPIHTEQLVLDLAQTHSLLEP